jgi:NTP pyrophosphatase (non-canonical NTP hydrolase)
MEQNPQKLPNEETFALQDYRQFVYKLECTKDEELKIRLDHAIDGLVTEAGELKTLIKKVKFYGAKIPRIKFLDEMADNLHYLVMAMNIMEVTFDDLMRLNKLKLKSRYPKGFSQEDALNRDRNKEREEMEKGVENAEESIS